MRHTSSKLALLSRGTYVSTDGRGLSSLLKVPVRCKELVLR